MGEDAAPRLPLGWVDELDSALHQLLVGIEDVGNLEGHADEASDEPLSFLVDRVDTFQRELSGAGRHLRPAQLIVLVGDGHPQGLGVETDRAIPVGDEHPDREQPVLHFNLLLMWGPRYGPHTPTLRAPASPGRFASVVRPQAPPFTPRRSRGAPRVCNRHSDGGLSWGASRLLVSRTGFF